MSLAGCAAMTASALVLDGCAGREASYRFRMTVVVETPQGLRTGSSVMEVQITRGMAIGDSSGVGSSVRGEAVVVDLPEGLLFVLLQMPDAGPPLQQVVAAALLGHSSDTPDAVMQDTAKLGSTWFSGYKADLPRTHDNGRDVTSNNWPMMVRFRDINDPKSVEKVDPDAVGIKRIVVETTRDPVTTGITNRLNWITKAEDFHYMGRDYGDIYPVPSNAFRSSVKRVVRSDVNKPFDTSQLSRPNQAIRASLRLCSKRDAPRSSR